MSTPLNSGDFRQDDLRDDVYFREDFVSLHARHGYDRVCSDDFIHGAGMVPVNGTNKFDLETPWGYGGPLAASHVALVEGINTWNARQRSIGRVAEFIRFHPLISVAAFEGLLDMLSYNRQTVFVDLTKNKTERWKNYSDSTRNCIRKAQRKLSVRKLQPDEGSIFQALYEAGLRRNAATLDYYWNADYFDRIIRQPWCNTWAAFDEEGPVAVSSFLHAGAPVCHYHLSGGHERSRQLNAVYLLLEEAIDYFSEQGCPFMHLGGGHSTQTDDPLLRFKQKFADMHAKFYIGGIIHNRHEYALYGGGQARFLCAPSAFSGGTDNSE